jgi:hypothetical protein
LRLTSSSICETENFCRQTLTKTSNAIDALAMRLH